MPEDLIEDTGKLRENRPGTWRGHRPEDSRLVVFGLRRKSEHDSDPLVRVKGVASEPSIVRIPGTGKGFTGVPFSRVDGHMSPIELVMILGESLVFLSFFGPGFLRDNLTLILAPRARYFAPGEIQRISHWHEGSEIETYLTNLLVSGSFSNYPEDRRSALSLRDSITGALSDSTTRLYFVRLLH